MLQPDLEDREGWYESLRRAAAASPHDDALAVVQLRHDLGHASDGLRFALEALLHLREDPSEGDWTSAVPRIVDDLFQFLDCAPALTNAERMLAGSRQFVPFDVDSALAGSGVPSLGICDSNVHSAIWQVCAFEIVRLIGLNVAGGTLTQCLAQTWAHWSSFTDGMRRDASAVIRNGLQDGPFRFKAVARWLADLRSEHLATDEALRRLWEHAVATMAPEVIDAPLGQPVRLEPKSAGVQREPTAMQEVRRAATLNSLPSSTRLAIDSSGVLLNKLRERESEVAKKERVPVRFDYDSLRRDLAALRRDGLVHPSKLLRTPKGDARVMA